MQAIVAKGPECRLPVKGDPALQKRQKSRDDAQQMMQQWLIGNAGRLDDRCMEGREASRTSSSHFLDICT